MLIRKGFHGKENNYYSLQTFKSKTKSMAGRRGFIQINKCDRSRGSVWNWFGLLSRKQIRRGFFNIDLFTWLNKKYVRVGLLRNSINFNVNNFQKSFKVYFLILYSYPSTSIDNASDYRPRRLRIDSRRRKAFLFVFLHFFLTVFKNYFNAIKR